jgi:hypothetical protein
VLLRETPSEQPTRPTLYAHMTLRLADGFGDEILLSHCTSHSDSTYLLRGTAYLRPRVASLNEFDERLGGEAAGFIAWGHHYSPRCLRSRAEGMVKHRLVGGDGRCWCRRAFRQAMAPQGCMRSFTA